MLNYKKTALIILNIIFINDYSTYFEISLKKKYLTKKEKNNLLNTWKAFKYKNEKLIISKNEIFLDCSNKTYKKILKIIEKIDKKERTLQINVRSGITKLENNDIWGINQSGIYNKQNIKKFGFRGVGGTVLDFPEPTEPIKPYYGNLYVDPLLFGVNTLPVDFLFDSIIFPVRSNSPLTLEPSYLPFTFGGNNLNTKRYNLFPEVYLQDTNTKISFNHTFITKSKKNHILKKELLIPIYSYKNIDKPDGGIYQKNQIIYIPDGANLQIKATIKKNNKINIKTFLKFNSLKRLTEDDFKQDIENGSLQTFLLELPPSFFNTTLYSEATINQNETLMLIMQKEQKPEFITRGTGFNVLDSLKKIFTSKKNNLEDQYNFILINAEEVF